MTIKTQVIREESYDPYFKVCFSYETDEVKIDKGYAEIVRKPPKPEITYDIDTETKLAGVDRFKLELELLNSVVNYMFSSPNRRYTRL